MLSLSFADPIVPPYVGPLWRRPTHASLQAMAPSASCTWQARQSALARRMVPKPGWVNRNLQDVIEYLREENRVLHEQLGGCGGRRLLFTDAQRPSLDIPNRLNAGESGSMFDGF